MLNHHIIHPIHLIYHLSIHLFIYPLNYSFIYLFISTIGCAVARVLIGWGVRNITFIDNGKVSFSNPVRQCLFTFEDCINRQYKAVAASDRLKQIYPGINSTGYVMSIPMPGHPLHNINGSLKHSNMRGGDGDGSSGISRGSNGSGSYSNEDDQDITDFYRLEQLIQSHDVCFTLTDSREARWLPTMLCTKYNKMLINSALGFDSYLVMYHDNCRYEDNNYNSCNNNYVGDGKDDGMMDINNGSNSDSKIYEQNHQQHHSIHKETLHKVSSKVTLPKSPELGCYFCNDIVAAQNSTRDRSIDQQCTVTRPGLSFVAAGLAVEVMVALIQKKKQKQISMMMTKKKMMDDDDNNNDDDGDNGDNIPHQIRGNVCGFSQITLKVRKKSNCILFY